MVARMPRRLLATAVVGILSISATLASELVGADPWRIIHLARQYGEAEVGRDSFGAPMIAGKLDGHAYEIVFHDCDLGRDCNVMLFRGIVDREEWREKAPRHRLFRDWNRSKLFGRAYMDRQNRAVVESTATLAGGVPEENVRNLFERWRVTLREFLEHVE